MSIVTFSPLSLVNIIKAEFAGPATLPQVPAFFREAESKGR